MENLPKMSKIEFRKVISAPEIKKAVQDICDAHGLTYTEYAYGLILDDILRRKEEKKLSLDLAAEKLSVKTFLGEVSRVVEKYSRELASK